MRTNPGNPNDGNPLISGAGVKEPSLNLAILVPLIDFGAGVKNNHGS